MLGFSKYLADLLHKFSDSVCRLNTLIIGRNQGHTNMLAARVNTMCFAGQVTSRQDSHILIGENIPGKVLVTTRCFCPKVETGIWFFDIQNR